MFRKQPKTLRGFGMQVSHEAVYELYERLGLPDRLARRRKLDLANDVNGAFWQVFTDGEIDLPCRAVLKSDADLVRIFGRGRYGEGEFTHRVSALRRRVERGEEPLDPAFEQLQLHTGTLLADILAADQHLQSGIQRASRFHQGAIHFQPVRREDFAVVEDLGEIDNVIDINPGVRSSYTVHDLYTRKFDGSSPQFHYWTVHPNDFHGQFLYGYADQFGEQVYRLAKDPNLRISGSAGHLVLVGDAIHAQGGKTVQALLEDSGLSIGKSEPAARIRHYNDKSHAAGKIDLVLWTDRSVLRTTAEDLAGVLAEVRRALRPGGGLLLGAPVDGVVDSAAALDFPALSRVAREVFGDAAVRDYFAAVDIGTGQTSPLSYVFVRTPAR